MKTICTIRPRTIAGLLRIAPREELRYMLCGIHVEPETGMLVATDGHCLVAHRTDARVSDVAPFTIPVDALASIAKAKCAAVRVSIAEDANFGERVITLECGYGHGADFCPAGATLTAKEINGHFPPWRHTVPTAPSLEVGQFNPSILANVREALRDICDTPKNKLFCVTLSYNGPQGAALVTTETHTDTLGVVMPWIADGSPDATLTTMGLAATATTTEPTSLDAYRERVRANGSPVRERTL
jgi:hypothetical protein